MNQLTSRRGLLFLPVIFLAGCLVSSSSNQRFTGNYVAPNTFDRIETGTTTAAWVQATLGEPTSRQKTDPGVEVWRYSYVEERNSSGAIFLIFGGSSRKEQQRAAFVELKDGVVTNKWRS